MFIKKILLLLFLINSRSHVSCTLSNASLFSTKKPTLSSHGFFLKTSLYLSSYYSTFAIHRLVRHFSETITVAFRNSSNEVIRCLPSSSVTKFDILHILTCCSKCCSECNLLHGKLCKYFDCVSIVYVFIFC